MAYIGREPQIGNFQICDAISVVDAQAAYTMQVDTVDVSPESANHMIVSLNGVIQKPTDAYTVSGSTITFASALETGDVIDFIQILGNVLDLGVPSDSTVSLAKLTATGTKDATTFLRGDNTFAAAGSPSITDNGNATAITINSSEQVEFTAGTALLPAITTTGDANTGMWFPSADTIAFAEGGAEAMRINSVGNTLINETTDHGINTGRLQVTGRASSNIARFRAGSNGEQISFHNASNTQVGTITIDASATSYNTSSDHRLKENVNYNFNATTRLKQLKPARFNFIADADKTIDGFIAHEVSSVVPEAISGTHNEVEVWKDNEELSEGVSVGDNKLDNDGNTIPKYQGIDQSKLVPLLVKTIQELEARITTLENA